MIVDFEDCSSFLSSLSLNVNIRVMSLRDCEKKWMNYSHLSLVELGESNCILEDKLHRTRYDVKFSKFLREIVPIPIFTCLQNECVVAQYKENLNWLSPLKYPIHVYNKGGASIPENDFVWRWEKMRNVGRESHTYLSHIIENYDELADVTMFTQGAIDDHGIRLYDIENAIKIASVEGRSHCAKIVEDYSNWGMINHKGKWADELKSGNMTPAKITFGDFYKSLFKRDHPASIKVYYAAIFAVRKDIIRMYPKEFYTEAIKHVDKSRNPGEGHYFERIWFEMFHHRPM